MADLLKNELISKGLKLGVYNEAVTKYAQSIFKNSVWGRPTEAFKHAKLKSPSEQLQLPMISVYRSGLKFDLPVNYKALKNGFVKGYTADIVTRERILPIKLEYTFDCWATEEDDCLDLFSELLFYIYDNSSIDIKRGQYDFKSQLIVTDIVDNADITFDVSAGRLCRFSIVTEMFAHISKVEDNDRIYIIPQVSLQNET